MHTLKKCAKTQAVTQYEVCVANQSFQLFSGRETYIGSYTHENLGRLICQYRYNHIFQSSANEEKKDLVNFLILYVVFVVFIFF